VTVGKLGYRPAMSEVTRILGGAGNDQPERMRAAAVFAFGLLTDPGDAGANQRLLGMVTAMEEPPLVKYEAIKALVHRNYAPALETLRKVAAESGQPMVRWGAHWAADKMSGQTTPYTPPDDPWKAEPSIRDLTP
jgi:hypothetical protein